MTIVLLRTHNILKAFGTGLATVAVVTWLGAGPSQAGEPKHATGFLRSGMPRPPSKAMTAQQAAAQSQCNGTFSDGSSISVASPTYLEDVPGEQVFCDFHTFAWNQFIYMTQMQADPNNGNAVTPLFLHMAPWYNLLKPNGSPTPSAYPGGNTALEGSNLDQGQAGDDDHLLDVNGATVLYDIRFNQAMYDAVVSDNTYTEAGYIAACKPDSTTGVCANPLWLPPTASGQPGAMEVKTAWRDFGDPSKCPQSQVYCNGRFGLVGVHIVQKTQTHGEWVWMSFEHVANDPDCYPGGDSPIAQTSPLGTAWSFFNPATVGSGVMASKMCEVTGSSPQCNANPKYYLSQKTYIYQPVNVCRTDYVPSGGASAANCAVIPDGPPQQSSNSPGNVACLNATFMPQMSGVWKNYKLIGSLWLRGSTGPEQDFRVQIFQQQESGIPYDQPVGFPNMANTTMETWMQSGSTGYDPFGTNATQAGCFLCHNLPTSGPPGFAADDLSHFPGKLPQDTLMREIKALLPAASTRKVKPTQRTAPN